MTTIREHVEATRDELLALAIFSRISTHYLPRLIDQQRAILDALDAAQIQVDDTVESPDYRVIYDPQRKGGTT